MDKIRNYETYLITRSGKQLAELARDLKKYYIGHDRSPDLNHVINLVHRELNINLVLSRELAIQAIKNEIISRWLSTKYANI